MNQPALRRIQTDAPGTFAHTLQVRNLAEPAADAIGANTRLVSAGVLYHDLGKTLKPEYFVENQMNAEERHSRLRPSVSTLLITAHVKDGMELAHEYGLPNQIIDFIPEHHGTTLVSYFYHTAKKNAESAENASDTTGHETDTVQEAFFRYPGPKPQSRETAIVMLADTVEAATRTLDNPSAARLRTFIHELIMNKMLDNQLDECDLTFAELMLVEAAFLRVLVSRFHSRIKYPGQTLETPEVHTEKAPQQENSHA
jgi:putative nucleotidyltransferase with HDIG domain